MPHLLTFNEELIWWLIQKKTIGQKTPWAIKKLLPLCWSNIYSIQVKKDGKAVIWGKKALHSPHKELSWQDMSESRRYFFPKKKVLIPATAHLQTSIHVNNMIILTSSQGTRNCKENGWNQGDKKTKTNYFR